MNCMEEQVLGNYRVLKKIGSGGMGSVYLARDTGLEREVVVKIISPQLARSPKLMARFRVEAIAQARLNHPNIVTIHSFEQQGDTYFIVMEYVPGKTLNNITGKQEKLPVEQALGLFSQALEGIAYAHCQGVLHRDIKPANIFVTPEGRLKIGDFGIAKVSGIDGLTRSGTTMGTLLYASPEQIRGEKVGPGTDIYSLGVTLYEMLTGVQPFKSGSGSDYEIQQAHLEKMPGGPAALNRAISSALDAVIMRSLSKDQAARFRDAAAFRRALEKAAQWEKKPGFLSRGGAGGSPLEAVKARIKAAPGFKNIKIRERLKNISSAGIFKTLKESAGRAVDFFKADGGDASLEENRKRTLLLILIPLLILLLVIAAVSL